MSSLLDARTIFGLVLTIGAIVLTAMGVMPVDTFESWSKWIFGIFAGGVTATAVADKLATGKIEAAKAMASMATKVSILFLIAFALASSSGCKDANHPGIAADAVNCTDGDEAALMKDLADDLKGIDLNKLEQQLEAAAVPIGGCILADLVDQYILTKKALPPGTPEPTDPRIALDKFRAKVVPGKAFVTAGGAR